MATTQYPTSTRNAVADLVAGLADAGTGGPGVLEVYTGTLPATGDDPIAGTLLATFTLADPAATAAALGTADYDFDPDLETTVLADGTAGCFEIADSDGNAALRGDVGTSGATLNFDAVAWVTGGTVKLATGSVTMPASA